MRIGLMSVRCSLWAVLCAAALFLVVSSSAGAFSKPAIFADTASPTNTIASYYNAIDRVEYLRAYSYLFVQSRPIFHQFALHWMDTEYVRLDSARVAGYYSVSSMQASLCVNVRLHIVHRQGRPVRYGGYYVLVSTTGEEPDFGGWRIDLPASRLGEMHRGQMIQDRCRIVL